LLRFVSDRKATIEKNSFPHSCSLFNSLKALPRLFQRSLSQRFALFNRLNFLYGMGHPIPASHNHFVTQPILTNLIHRY
jgi:hypothetical protein